MVRFLDFPYLLEDADEVDSFTYCEKGKFMDVLLYVDVEEMYSINMQISQIFKLYYPSMNELFLSSKFSSHTFDGFVYS